MHAGSRMRACSSVVARPGAGRAPAPRDGHHAAALGTYRVPAAFWGGENETSEASSVTMPIMLMTAMW